MGKVRTGGGSPGLTIGRLYIRPWRKILNFRMANEDAISFPEKAHKEYVNLWSNIEL